MIEKRRMYKTEREKKSGENWGKIGMYETEGKIGMYKNEGK